jgi:hypothetical protein
MTVVILLAMVLANGEVTTYAKRVPSMEVRQQVLPLMAARLPENYVLACVELHEEGKPS